MHAFTAIDLQQRECKGLEMLKSIQSHIMAYLVGFLSLLAPRHENYQLLLDAELAVRPTVGRACAIPSPNTHIHAHRARLPAHRHVCALLNAALALCSNYNNIEREVCYFRKEGW